MNRFQRFLKFNTKLATVTATLMIIIVAAGIHYILPATPSIAIPSPGPQAIPSVEVETVHPQSIRLWNEYAGHLRAVYHVEVRPLVGGTITKVLFQDGAIVKKGDLLFVIDPRPYEAEVASAVAAFQSAQSQADLANTELKRAEGLVHRKAVSMSRYDETKHNYQAALASVNSARARLKQAYLNLDYAYINAPVSGRISRAEITVGNVVEAGPNARVLTTIVSNDKLYAEFDMDEQTYVESIRQSSGEPMPVELNLTDDASVVYQGVIHSFDNRLDTTSGTIRVRALFENMDGALTPGMYVKVRLGSSQMQPALLIHHGAVGTDQDKKYVYVVTPDNQVAYRELTLGPSAGSYRVVLGGLEAGERVLVNSMLRVRPGMVVKPVEGTKHPETPA